MLARFGSAGELPLREQVAKALVNKGISFGVLCHSEAAIAVFQHFVETDPLRILGLVSPKVVRWANGELDDAEELIPNELAAQRMHADQQT